MDCLEMVSLPDFFLQNIIRIFVSLFMESYWECEMVKSCEVICLFDDVTGYPKRTKKT